VNPEQADNNEEIEKQFAVKGTWFCRDDTASTNADDMSSC